MTATRGPHAALISKLVTRISRLTSQRVSAVAKAYQTGPAPFDALARHLMQIADREGRGEAARHLVSRVASASVRAAGDHDVERLADELGLPELRRVGHDAARVLCLLPLALLVYDYVSEEDYDLAEMYFSSAVGHKPYQQRPDLMAPWRGRVLGSGARSE